MRLSGFAFFSYFVLALASLLGIGLMAAGVPFQPDGVPLAKRQDYDRIVARLGMEGQANKVAGNLGRGAIAVVEETDFNFGTIDPHTTVNHTFIIKNVGDATLSLVQGETSCKCTIGKLSRASLQPGETTEVTLTWNTGYQSSHYSQSAKVLTNDIKQKELVFQVHGIVRSDLAIVDQEIAFPAVDKGKLASAHTFVYSQLWSDFVIEDVVSELPGFQWSVEPISVDSLPQSDLQARSAWKLNLMSLPTHMGTYNGEIVIRAYPIDGGEPVERIIVASGRVRSPIAFQGPEVHDQRGLVLGDISPSSGFSKSVVVRVRGDDSRQMAVLDIKPDALRAEILPTSLPGAFRLTITVPHDAKTTIFNLPKSHGYVQVGDPHDKQFANWIPLWGVILAD